MHAAIQSESPQIGGAMSRTKDWWIAVVRDRGPTRQEMEACTNPAYQDWLEEDIGELRISGTHPSHP